MVYLQLFLSFMKIGFTSFGGLSMIPLILEEMVSHGWMTASDLANLVAIAEMTPGPIGINCATFTGTQTAGLGGSLSAVVGVLSPTLTLTLLAAVFFAKFKNNRVTRSIMAFVKPVCIAILASVLITLAGESWFSDGRPLPFSIGISVLMMVVILKWKWSVPKVILCAAALGILFYGVLPMMG